MDRYHQYKDMLLDEFVEEKKREFEKAANAEEGENEE